MFAFRKRGALCQDKLSLRVTAYRDGVCVCVCVCSLRKQGFAGPAAPGELLTLLLSGFAIELYIDM